MQLVECETGEEKRMGSTPTGHKFFLQKLHLTGEKKERKRKLYTPDTEACVPYLTRVQSSVTTNTYILGVTLDWTRVPGQVRKK